MYESLLLPWSPTHLASAAETTYRASGLLRTKGTIFLLPPTTSTLRQTYNAPPRARTRMSAGAVALCKHFERGGASSEHGRPHPYWERPLGGNEVKTATAERVLERMLAEGVWRNVMLLHPGVAVYEVRNGRGWGMRWTLEVVQKSGQGGAGAGAGGVVEATGEGEGGATDVDGGASWEIVNTTFRGFVEPIEGMDHEVDGGEGPL